MIARWTDEMLRAHQARIGNGAGRIVRPMGEDVPAPAKPSKHRAKPVMFDGVRFDSRLEARIWQELQLREKAGEIANLRRQIRFSLFAGGGEHVGIYTADFVYDEPGQMLPWKRVVADAKSEHTRTLATWRRTRKLMQACHGIDVRELP